jgi:DNA-binding transcriptional MerR regulator
VAEIRDRSVFTARTVRREEARELMNALLTGFTERVRAVIGRTLQRSDSLLFVVSDLVDSTRQEIEDMWYRGELGIMDERRILGQLDEVVSEAAQEHTSPSSHARSCILTAIDETVGKICRSLLEEDGWSVRSLLLGDLVSQSLLLPPAERRLVVFVGIAAPASPKLKAVVNRLKAQGSRVLLMVPDQWAHAGGWQQLGADECAGNAQTLILMARKLSSAESTFSISEVAASLRVTPHAIRAWERRYKLPFPQRDSVGQRRYTAEDIQLLFRISHAATVHGHSLKLAALEAQGLITDDMADLVNPSPVVGTEVPGSPGQSWRRVADAIPDMLMLIDAEGKIVDCNVATARARDTVRENLRGARLTDLIVEYDRAKAVRLYRPVPRRRRGWELRMRAPNQDLAVVAFDSHVVVGHEGRLLGLIGRTVLHEAAA